jgi:hypothetical protein
MDKQVMIEAMLNNGWIDTAEAKLLAERDAAEVRLTYEELTVDFAEQKERDDDHE